LELRPFFIWERWFSVGHWLPFLREFCYFSTLKSLKMRHNSKGWNTLKPNYKMLDQIDVSVINTTLTPEERLLLSEFIKKCKEEDASKNALKTVGRKPRIASKGETQKAK
jgi:hypothetical protein